MNTNWRAIRWYAGSFLELALVVTAVSGYSKFANVFTFYTGFLLLLCACIVLVGLHLFGYFQYTHILTSTFFGTTKTKNL